MTIATQLAGRRVGVTGATGFIGQALLSTLLAHVPDCHLVVLVRGRDGASGDERLRGLMRSSAAFELVRQADPDLTVAFGRIEVVDGDFASENLTLPSLDVLLHVAGTVSFDVPIHEAFRTHVSGVDDLYRAAHAAGCDHVVHVSTAYVAARRPGPAPEASAGAGIDWRREADAAMALAERADLASRMPARLQRLLDEAKRKVGPQGDDVVAAQAERARWEWVHDQLVDAGRQRARTQGFSDVYTFTKALGERVAQERFADRQLTVVRPTIVESALRFPAPGWIEGFKVADPLIIGLGRGDIPDFPGFPDGIIDLVPVDFVVNAIVAAAAHPPQPRHPVVLNVGTGARNPLTLHRLYQLIRDYFEHHPLPGRDGLAARPPAWRFAGPELLAWQLRTATTWVERADRALQRSPITGERVRRWGRTLGQQRRRLGTLDRLLQLYGCYAEVETTFLDDNTQALRDRLEPADRDRFGFDPADIDWPAYIQGLHVPAVAAPMHLFAGVKERTEAALPAVQQPDDSGAVLAVFDLDGTVAATNVIATYLRARWHDDRVDALLEALDVLRTMPKYLTADSTSRQRFLRGFYRRFAGADLAALDRLVSDELSDALIRDLTPAAVRRIREHRAQGHRTVLVTGALRCFCTPLATLFDTIAAADLEADERGIATGHLTAAPLVGATRAAWLRHYARETGADLSASYAYADSRSDVPLLRCVGNPVAVDPDLALLRVARRERWPVATWRTGSRRTDGHRVHAEVSS